MVKQDGKIDRRTLLKLMSDASVGATVASTGAMPWCAEPSVHAAGTSQSGITPFEIHVSDDELEDLRRRLATGQATHPVKRGLMEQTVSTWKS